MLSRTFSRFGSGGTNSGRNFTLPPLLMNGYSSSYINYTPISRSIRTSSATNAGLNVDFGPNSITSYGFDKSSKYHLTFPSSRSFSATANVYNNSSSNSSTNVGFNPQFTSNTSIILANDYQSKPLLSSFSENDNINQDTNYTLTLLQNAIKSDPVDWNSIIDLLRSLREDKSYNTVLDVLSLILGSLTNITTTLRPLEPTSETHSPEVIETSSASTQYTPTPSNTTHKSLEPPSQLYEELLLTLYESITVTYTTSSPQPLSPQTSTKLTHISPNHAILFSLILDHMIASNHLIPYQFLSMFHKLILPLGDSFFTQKYLQISHHVPIITTAQKKRNMSNIIYLHISSGDIESALYSLREMTEANAGNLSLRRNLYETLLLATIHENDIEYSRQIISYLHSTGPVHGRTWGIFISHACKLMDYENVNWAWQTAIIPGRVILSDWCYQKMVDIGRMNGNLSLTRWALLREQRRKQALEKPDNTNPMNQFSALLEASSKKKHIIDCIKLIQRIGEKGCSLLKLRDFPRLIENLSSDNELLFKVFKHLKPILENKTLTSYSPSTKILYFNILLRSFVNANLDTKFILDLYRSALFDYNLTYNEDTMLSIIQLAKQQNDVFLARQVLLFDCGAFKVQRTRRMFEYTINLCRDLNHNEAADEYIMIMQQHGLKLRQYLRQPINN